MNLSLNCLLIPWVISACYYQLNSCACASEFKKMANIGQEPQTLAFGLCHSDSTATSNGSLSIGNTLLACTSGNINTLWPTLGKLNLSMALAKNKLKGGVASSETTK